MFDIEQFITELYKEMESTTFLPRHLLTDDKLKKLIECAYNQNLEIKDLKADIQKLEFINNILIEKLRSIGEK